MAAGGVVAAGSSLPPQARAITLNNAKIDANARILHKVPDFIRNFPFSVMVSTSSYYTGEYWPNSE